MPPVLYDARELAEALGVRYDDVLSWARRGVIPRIVSGRRTVFNLDRVIEALSARKGEEGASIASARK